MILKSWSAVQRYLCAHRFTLDSSNQHQRGEIQMLDQMCRKPRSLSWFWISLWGQLP